MIPDYIIVFIIMLLLSYVFGNRLIPQLAVIVFTFVEIITTASSTINDTTFYYTMVLYAVNLIYAVMNLIIKEHEG